MHAHLFSWMSHSTPWWKINCSVLELQRTAVLVYVNDLLVILRLFLFEDKYQVAVALIKGMASAAWIYSRLDIQRNSPIKFKIARRTYFLKTFDASGVARLDFLVKSEKWRSFTSMNKLQSWVFFCLLWDKSDMNFKQLWRVNINRNPKDQAKNGRIRAMILTY